LKPGPSKHKERQLADIPPRHIPNTC